jgi:hypothetical protein
VQPNSGYERDNFCMLDAIAGSEGRLKGITIVDLKTDIGTLKTLKAQGIVGAAINATFHGNDYYRDAGRLIAKLADLDMMLSCRSSTISF